MKNENKKLIAGFLLFIAGVIPTPYWWAWFPCSCVGWWLLFYWCD